MRHVKLFETFLDDLNQIDSQLDKEKYHKYYVGYIDPQYGSDHKKDNYRTWSDYGTFKGLDTRSEVFALINQIVGKYPKECIKIFSPEEYLEVKRARKHNLF